MKKLTLSAEEDVVTAARQIAKARGTSISALFSRFIRSLASETAPAQVGRLTRRASGLIELADGESATEILTDALLQKHGLDS